LIPPDELERTNMNNKFDELTKSLAQSVTRRAALKKFGLGLGGLALAAVALANKAEAGSCKGSGQPCKSGLECCSRVCSGGPLLGKSKPVCW
jgi:hypothetical protein